MASYAYDGIRIHYSPEGPADAQRTPVLLIHGLGSSGDDWIFQGDVLAGRRAIAAIDLPGFGKSDGFHFVPRIEDYARAAAGLCREVWGRPVHVVGLSLGGAVGLEMAAQNAEGVASVVAVGTPSGLSLGLGGLLLGFPLLASVLLGRMNWVGWLVARDLFPEEDQKIIRLEAQQRLANNRRGDYLRALAALGRSRLGKDVARLECPVLIVAGAQDRTVRVGEQRKLADRIRGARFAEVPGSRHATPVDSPEVFNRLLLNFLDEVESAELGSNGLAGEAA